MLTKLRRPSVVVGAVVALLMVLAAGVTLPAEQQTVKDWRLL